MSRLTKWLWIGCVVPPAFGILAACADDETGATPPADGADASADVAEDVDGAVNSDAEIDAGIPKCADSKICLADFAVPRRVSFNSVHGSGRSDVWAVGNQGVVAHYDGTRWEFAEPDVPDGGVLYTIRGVRSQRPDDVWMIEGDRVRHSTGWKGPGTKWSTYRYPIVGDGYVMTLPNVITGFGGSVWIGHQDYHHQSLFVERYRSWNEAAPAAPEGMYARTKEVHAMATAREGEIWYGGECARPGGDTCAFVAKAPGAGGAEAPISEWEITEFDLRLDVSPKAGWAHGDDVWFVGEGGQIRRVTTQSRETKTFELVNSPVASDLQSVHGFAANDIWAVGDAGVVLHWDGTRWSVLSTPLDVLPLRPRLLSVWGSAPGDVWIVGDGVMLHFEENAK